MSSRAVEALSLLAIYNIIQNSLLNQKGYVGGNAVATAALIDMGWAAGLSWDEMGFGRGELRSSLQMGAGLVAASAIFLLTAPRLRTVRPYLRDERVTREGKGDTVYRVLVRYPLGTALFEEVGFRGVLPGLLSTDDRSGDIASAVAFGIWHLLPAHHALAVNGVRTGWARTTRTALGAIAAAVGGYALSRIRRKTGSLLAPWMIHSVLNTTAYLAVVSGSSERNDP